MMLGKDRALWDRDAVYIPDPVLQNRPGVGGVGQYTITERNPPFSVGVLPPPTRFALPAARGKTSLNARDW